jgi:hypothetical protein
VDPPVDPTAYLNPPPVKAEILDKEQALDRDRKLFEKYEKKGLVSIKTLIMK